MDITSQIISTLIAGATIVGKDVATLAIRDSYSALKSMVVNLFGAPADAAVEKIQLCPTDSDAQKALNDAVGTIQPSDITRLEEMLTKLQQAILENSEAKSVVDKLGPEVTVVFKNIKKLSVGNITSKDHRRATVDFGNIDDVVVRDISFESKPGK